MTMRHISEVLADLMCDIENERAARDMAAQIQAKKTGSSDTRAQLDSRQGGAVAFGARAVSGDEVPVYIAPRTGRTASDPGADTNAGLRTGMVPANQNQGPKRTHAPVLRGAVPLVVVWG